MSVLFEPFSIRGLKMPNRVVMAPMTRNYSPSAIPGQNVADYYARRAEYNVGLIITEGTVVDRPEAANHPYIPHFHGEAALAGWGKVVEDVHANGGRIAPQIWHTGLVPEQMPDAPRPGEAEGPSGLAGADKPYGKEMTEEDVADTVAAFGKAAADAARLGFDSVELHGAHGYLIDQFFWHVTNQRSDRFGGPTLADRTAFAAEIVKAVRAGAGDLPIILRVSQWKQQQYDARLAPSPDEIEAWLTPLRDAGVDIFHCSQRRFWEPEFPEIDGEEGLNFAGWVKKILAVPTISVGSVSLDTDFFSVFSGQSSGASGLGDLERRMEAEEFDLIAVGRSLIANPDWAEKVKAGRSSELEGFDMKKLGELV